jgi:multidrug efflux pump
MRLWLNPHKLRQYGLMPSDIRAAVEAQNTQVAAGAIGELPSLSDQYLNAKVTSGTRLKTVEEFENIIVKSTRDGSFIYLKDVARVELGAENYQSFNTINGFPSAGMGISLSSGANALATSALIKQEVARLSSKLPEGYQIVYPRDNTPILQKYKHDHNHQKHCFKQCFDHFLNRLLHKRRVITWINNLIAFRQFRR